MANPVNEKICEEINTYEDVSVSPYIVYQYINKETNRVVYVGSDRQGDKRTRHRAHFVPSRRGEQKANDWLQREYKKFIYQVIAIVSDEDSMYDIEAALIAAYKVIGQCEFNIKDELKIGLDGKENEK